jgi:CTP synthase
VPLQYHAEGLDAEVLRGFGITDAPAPDLAAWHDVTDRYFNPEGEVTIAVVGKYVGLQDAYKSLNEALIHGGLANRVKVNIKWIDAEIFEGDDEAAMVSALEPMHGILVPGGFGERGSEGKIASVRFARERGVPFFGICLGMQMACIEGARAAGFAKASSTEFGETETPVVGIITEWMSKEGLQQRESGGDLGGTMRLGAYPAKLSANSHTSRMYGGADVISERHRHRYEVNSGFIEPLEKQGLIFAGMSPDGLLPEIVERPDHPWFVGVQFHPELKSRPFDPHPLFAGFIAAAVEQSRLV